MPSRKVTLCKPCLNKKYPLRKQLLLSFLTIAAVSLLLALGVVIGTTAYIGGKAEKEAHASLQEQIIRHLTDASAGAATTIGETFRKLQYGMLDVTAFALRDALQQDLVLAGGEVGYPLSPAHTDLRDTEITTSTEANLEDTSRHDEPVDLSRSVWYYADADSFDVEVLEEDMNIITQTARLDLLWPTMYINSNDTKAIYVGKEMTLDNTQMFRYFPGSALSEVENSTFKCDSEDEDGCYDPTGRPWYTSATIDLGNQYSSSTFLGDAIITTPYNDAVGSETDWLVTLARAVYSDSGGVELLGVVGVDVRLEQVQAAVEGINFLDTGYSILATADDGTVLADGSGVWDRKENKTAKVCDLDIGICSGVDGWQVLLEKTKDYEKMDFTSSVSTAGGAEDWFLIAAPVKATFDTADAGGNGTVTHYILSAVPEKEIFESVVEMVGKIQKSTTQIIITTAVVACCTLFAVGLSIFFMAGSITRPIARMTAAARSIANDGAKTNVFGSVIKEWGRREAASAGRYSKALDYLLCRGEDEISTLAREFTDMITGLGKRGSAAHGIALEERTEFPQNPFTTEIGRLPPAVPASAPTAA